MTPEEARKEFAKYPYAGHVTLTVGFATIALLVERASIPNELRAAWVEDIVKKVKS